MKIPIQYILLMFIETFPFIKGEKCWAPMVCDGQPTWRDVNTGRALAVVSYYIYLALFQTGQCTKDEQNALKGFAALTEKLDGVESKLHHLKKTMEESETYSVSPSVVDVKETTTPSGAGVKDTTTPSAAGAEKKTTPSLAGVKETTTLSVASVKETTTSEGFKDKKSTSARTSTVPATSLWSTKEAFFSTFCPQTTKVEQSTVDLACDFESSTNPTCGYTRVEGRFRREYRDNDVTGYVLAGKGKIRSLPRDLVSNEELCMSVNVKGTSDGELVAKAYDGLDSNDMFCYVLAGTGTIRSLLKALAGNEELCMSVAIKGTSDGELVAKANNGTVTEAIWPFSASTTWKTEKFILKKKNSADTEVQLDLVASGNVELDNITTLNSSECCGPATPCTKRNLENATISPEQELYSKDQEVSYSCSNDSILEGEHTGTCEADGSWSTTPACTKCGVVYNSKCFRAIVYDVKNVTFNLAKSLCKNKLANIYDVTHFNLVRDYLRSMIPDGESLIFVCTGMSYKNSHLYSTTGQAMSLPTEVWRSDYPISQESWTTVAVRVHRKPEYKYQGIYNYAPTSICENEL
ncbi:uncharacterized protein LOC144428047 [Styela clava]